MKEKVVIVTGGAGGIGRATARRFAAAGARVAVWDVKAEGPEELEAELATLRGEAPREADVVPLRPARGPNPAGG